MRSRWSERMEREARAASTTCGSPPRDSSLGSVESLSGDYGKANALAKEARALADGASDPNLGYWSAMMIGITARGRGQIGRIARQSADRAFDGGGTRATPTGARTRSTRFPSSIWR